MSRTRESLLCPNGCSRFELERGVLTDTYEPVVLIPGQRCPECHEIAFFDRADLPLVMTGGGPL